MVVKHLRFGKGFSVALRNKRGTAHEIRNTGHTPLKTFNVYVPPAYRSDGEELPRGHGRFQRPKRRLSSNMVVSLRIMALAFAAAVTGPACGAQLPPTADSVLTALLADSRIALDSTGAGGRYAQHRQCAPTRVHSRIALGVPRVHGDTADIQTAASVPASATESAFVHRGRTVLAHVHGHWAVVAHPDMRFKTLAPPVRPNGVR